MLFVVAIIFFAMGLFGLSAGHTHESTIYGFLVVGITALLAAIYTVERPAPRNRLPDTRQQRQASNLLK